ncbi:resolvase, partial [Lacticaseibacillus rhamnosus]
MLKPDKMAKRSVSLQKWDKSRKFKAHIAPTNRCYDTEDQHLACIGHADESKKHR